MTETTKELTMTKRWITGLAVLATAAAVLSACGDADDATPSTEAESASTEAASASTAGSYEEVPCFSIDDIEETQLSDAVTCGFLTVPEDRTDPGGPTIKIAVGRLAAEVPSPDAEPMVYLNGGPGSTSIMLADQLRERGLNDDRDVIFVGQRGTLYSEPHLACPEYDAFLADVVPISRLSVEAEEASAAAVQACHDRLVSDGVDLSAFNTEENAADVADLRVSLGIDSWHVYGVSYGTLLALTVVRDHPEGVTSVVLDSVVPPQDNLLTHLWASAAGGYEAIFEGCEAQPDCAAAYPDLAAELDATVTRLATDPLVVEVPASDDAPAQEVVVDGYTFADLIVVMSSHPEQAAVIPQMVHATAAGDGQIVAEAAVANVPTISLMGVGLRYGVVCSEFAPFTTPAEILADSSAALPGFPDSVLELSPQFGSIMSDCALWDVAPADASVSQPVASDLPVLLLTGTYDAITQPFLADSAAATLTNSQVVRFPGLGHDVVMNSPCGREIVAAFHDAPDAYETTCVADMPILAFAT